MLLRDNFSVSGDKCDFWGGIKLNLEKKFKYNIRGIVIEGISFVRYGF